MVFYYIHEAPPKVRRKCYECVNGLLPLSLKSKLLRLTLEVVAQRWKEFVLFLCTRLQVLLCTPVIPAVFYMLTGLARYSVDPGINCDARKLARTPRITKKIK